MDKITEIKSAYIACIAELNKDWVGSINQYGNISAAIEKLRDKALKQVETPVPAKEKLYHIESYVTKQGVWFYSPAVTATPEYPNYCLNYVDSSTRITGPYATENPKEYKIHSVKRLSDGEVFKIGDTITDSRYETREIEIENFQLGLYGDMWANEKWERGQRSIQYWKKVEHSKQKRYVNVKLEVYMTDPEFESYMNDLSNDQRTLSAQEYKKDAPVQEGNVLLVTEDGVAIKDPNQKLWTVDIEDWELDDTAIAKHYDYYEDHWKWFSTPVCSVLYHSSLPLPSSSVCSEQSLLLHWILGCPVSLSGRASGILAC